jgi:hypothetical protein
VPDSLLEQLIAELQDDGPGSLADTVEQALEFARDHLLDAAEGAGSSAADGASEQFAYAIDALQLYRERLEQLAADLESIERELTRIQGDADLGEVGFSGF